MSVDVIPAASQRCTDTRREDEFLSNFSGHPVCWQGITYRTAEAAFQAGKTLDPAQRD